jgi:hypothetical protein
MQKYTDVVTSARSGAAIPSASVTVKTSPGGVTATIYSDDGVTTQSNPLTTDSNGEFTFYAADGEYTLTVSGTGITSRTIGPIILHDPADSDDYMPSTDVSFTPSGSGAVSRTVSARLMDRASVFDFIPVALQAGISAGTGTTNLHTYIQAAFDAADTVDFPDGTYYCGAPVKAGDGNTLNLGNAILVRNWDSTAPITNKYSDALIRQKATVAGSPNSNIKIIGGRLQSTGSNSGVQLGLFFVEDVLIDGLQIDSYYDDWAFTVLGDRIRIKGVVIKGGDAVFEDGIHVMGGDDISIDGCVISAGDDAIAIGTDSSDASDIANVTVSNCVVHSAKAFGCKVYAQSGLTNTVTSVTISNLTGTSGETRSGGIALFNDPTTRYITGVSISNVQLRTPAAATTNTTNPYGLWIEYAEDVHVSNCRFAGYPQGFYINQARDIWLDGVRFSDTPDTASNYPGGEVLSCDNVNLEVVEIEDPDDNCIEVVGTPRLTLRRVRGVDIKDGKHFVRVDSGTTTELYMHDCHGAQVGGTTTGYGISLAASTTTFMRVTDCSFNGMSQGGLDTTNLPTNYIIDNNRSQVGTGDVLVFNTGDLEINSGAPTRGTVAGGRDNAWLLDAGSSAEILSCQYPTPHGWATANIKFFWTNAGAGTGDVLLRAVGKSFADGAAMNSADTTFGTQTVAADTQDDLVITTVATGVALTANGYNRLRVLRVGADVADTLANDIGLMMVKVERAS